MRTVRVWFTKTGSARFISHLDLMRCFTRALRKTDIALWYTEGYNPRLHMVFTLSLPLGVEGQKESFDVRVLSEESNEELLIKLAAVSSEGLLFTDVTESLHMPSEVAFARYAAILADAPDSLAALFCAIVAEGTLSAVKKNKKGIERQIALSEALKGFSAVQDGNTVRIFFTLPAGNEDSVSPFLFLNALFEKTKTDLSDCRIVREKLLLSDKTDFT